MSKWIITGLFCLVVHTIFSQSKYLQKEYFGSPQYLFVDNCDDYLKNIILIDTSDISGSAGLRSNVISLSNSLSNRFVNAIFTSKYIDSELKKTSKISETNYFQNSTDIELYYYWRLRKFPGTGFLISLSDNYYTDIKFSGDYFNLVFFGNKDFAGKTADLSGFDLNFISYQKFRFGLKKDFGSLKIFASLAMVKGQNNYSAEFQNAKIFTEQTGEYVDFDLSYNYFSSDTANSGIGVFNGLGYATDIYCSYTLKLNNKDIRFFLFLDDFGRIDWNEKSLIVRNDTSFTYSGEEIQSVLDLGPADFSQFSKDSLKEDFYYSKSKSGTYQTALPGKIAFSGSFLISDLMLCSPGMYYRCFSNMPLPYFYISNKRYFGNPCGRYCALVFQPGYGGYCGFQFGLGFELLYNRIHFKISSSNVAGFIFPEKTYSEGISFAFGYNFSKPKTP